jgi:hypothetical protein
MKPGPGFRCWRWSVDRRAYAEDSPKEKAEKQGKTRKMAPNPQRSLQV